LALAVFLVLYLGKNKATVTIINKSGIDLIEGQLKISSLATEQETGPIRNGDSAVLSFQGFSEGEYVLSVKPQAGKAVRASGGYLTRGTNFKDRIYIETVSDSLRIRFDQAIR
jgi:hypothetical protein